MISQRKVNNNDDTIANNNNVLQSDTIIAVDNLNRSISTVSCDSEDNLEKQYEANAVYDACPLNCEKDTRAQGIKLLIGVIGIYITYLYYGTLQEEVYTYPSFSYIWFVQVLEGFTNMVGAHLGRLYNKTRDSHSINDTSQKRYVSHYLFLLCGTYQICSKALTSSSLNSGLSYPVATLAKSSRMLPVMIGQLFLGNSKYSSRDYVQVSCIIIGTAILGLSKSQYQSTGSPSSAAGINFIVMSLFMDGVTGGLQKRIKEDAKATGDSVQGFDFMFYTNMYMLAVATIVAIVNTDLVVGFYFCVNNPEIKHLIFKFCMCSAAGQSFIYFTIANFDPLVCSTVTTTRKIASVLLSIWYKGHRLNHQGWSGIFLAFLGIASELQHKFQRARSNEKKDLKG